jgi:serine/threonine-protein kinase
MRSVTRREPLTGAVYFALSMDESPSRRTVDPAFSAALQGLARELMGEGIWGVPSEVFEDAKFKYELGPRLGMGGTGIVYRAYDPLLRRTVALKFLRKQSPAMLERFRREAQAQARVEHERVARIYEVGEVAGISYIGLQYIDGRRLDALRDVMSFDEKAMVMREVAEAVHAAHRVGLIHRDLKPANILVERDEGGPWRPYVLDFGLARVAQESQMTVTGEVLGTPQYMAPEQALGDLARIDRRTDVYGLGATLYHLLTGTPPVRGSSIAEMLSDILGGEAIPVRRQNRAVPVDLESIAMKCLEKEPELRYDSARALADDLQRYLDREPVRARRSTWLSRLVKLVRRNRALSAVSILAAGGILVAGAAAFFASARATTQAAAAQRFGEEVRAIENIMRTAYLLPLHDVSPEKARVRAQMKAIEAEIARLGSAAEGPGHYALGRGHLALRESDRARQHLEHAWALPYRTAEVALALGQALGALYQEGLDEADRLPSKKSREERREELRAKWREPALYYLRQASTASDENPVLLEALLAYYEGDYKTAIAKARAATAQDPWLYESRRIEALVYLARAEERRDRNAYAEALRELDRTGEVLRAAIAVGRSDPALYEADCRRWLAVLLVGRAQGGDLRAPTAAARASCENAIRADHELWGPFVAASSVFNEVAFLQLQSGGDPSDAIGHALAMTVEGLRHGKGVSELHANAGIAHMRRAGFQESLGRDPSPDYEHALENLQRAIASNPQNPKPYANAAYALYLWARYEAEHGIDPRPRLRSSAKWCEKALQVKPNYPYAWNTAGGAYAEMLHYEVAHGLDPRESAERARDALRRALALNERYVWARGSLGEVDRELARWDLDAGRDPTPRVQSAIRSIEERLRLNQHGAKPRAVLAGAFGIQATYEMLSGLSPGATIERGVRALRGGAALSPRDSESYATLEELYVLRMEAAVARGRDPTPDAAQAIEAYAHAVHGNRSLREAHVGRARIALALGSWRAAHGRSPVGAFDEALAYSGKALAIDSRDPGAHVAIAQAHLQRAAWWRRRDAARHREALEQGRKSVSAALASGPRHAVARAIASALGGAAVGEELKAALRRSPWLRWKAGQ